MSPIEWIVILVSLISGTLGALGVGGYFYFRDRADLQNRRRWQEQHLARVQRLTSKLLNALDRLVGGSIPEETILYQRFKAHGGEYYTDIQADVIETLHRSQSALNAAFELRQQLIDPDTRQSRSLEQQIWDWEMLYATLAGRSEHILNMTGDEIRVLLDPLADPGNEAEPDELVASLGTMSHELRGAVDIVYADDRLSDRLDDLAAGDVREEFQNVDVHLLRAGLIRRVRGPRPSRVVLRAPAVAALVS